MTTNSTPDTPDDGLEYCPDCGSDYLMEGIEACRYLHDGSYEYTVPLMCLNCGCEWKQVYILFPDGADDSEKSEQ